MFAAAVTLICAIAVLLSGADARLSGPRDEALATPRAPRNDGDEALAAPRAPRTADDGLPTLRKTSETILSSRVAPGNLLPNFMQSQSRVESGTAIKLGAGRGVRATTIPDDSCGEDIFDSLNPDLRSPQLPNLSQDIWGCEREEEEIDVWVYENDWMKVGITPQWGGRVNSIVDKITGRENLFKNKAHQPASIGVLKAWTAGGLEWNWSPGVIGHSAFTETQVYMAKVDSPLGQVVRVYEFDRLNGTVWQVDMLLANSTFLAHPKVTNPTDVDLRGYWWTCMAVPSTPGTRILTPATHVAETSRLPVGDAPWPVFAEAIENATFHAQFNDNSYLGKHPSSGDFFLRIPSDQPEGPWIGHVADNDGSGYAFLHGHPLNGTKFFVWGESGPGRFMQDFLAGGRERQGDYTELQVGVAPTQLQTFSLPAQTTKEWTEWFKPTGSALSAETLHQADYAAMLRAVQAWISSPAGAPRDEVAQLDAVLAKLADQPVQASDILVSGQPWGALEEMLLGRPLAPGLKFTLPDPGQPGFDEAQPWVELLQTGNFGDASLSRLPLSYQTTDRWFAKILAAPTSWLQCLHAAICYMERGDGTNAKNYLQKSMDLRPNPIAARGLALLTATYPDAMVEYKTAWKILTSDYAADAAYPRLVLNLAAEMAVVLTQASLWDDMRWLLAVAPPQALALDPLLKMQATLLVHDGQFDEAMAILEGNCFPTYASERGTLVTLWQKAVEERAGAVSELDKHRARMATPIPRNIGCQKGSRYCLNYW